MPEAQEVNLWGYTMVRPTVIGQGGEHYVYQQYKYACKINVLTLKKFLTGRMEAEEVEAFAAQRQLRHQRLRNLIGEEHVASEHTVFEMRWLSAEDCLMIAPDTVREAAHGSIRVPIITTVQNHLPELEFPEIYGVTSVGNGLYTEEIPLHQPSDLADYNHAIAQLVLDVEGREPSAPLPKGTWATRQYDMLDRNLNNAGECARLAHAYTIATGEALDLAGTYNCVVYPAGQPPYFKLIDALWPTETAILTEAATAILALNQEAMPEFSLSQKIGIMNAINYVRTINYLLWATRGPNYPALDIFRGRGNINWRPEVPGRIYQVCNEALQQIRPTADGE